MTEQKFKGKHKTSWVTRITLVLWIGNETLHKLSFFGTASRYADCLKPIYNLIHWLMARTCHLLLRFLCRKRTCQQRKELGSKRSVSFPIQWTRVTRVTRDVLFHRFTRRCISFHVWETMYQIHQAKTLPYLARLRTRQHARPVQTDRTWEPGAVSRSKL